MAGVDSGAAARPLRWTADTEVAFLLALRLTGTMAAACAAIGRSTGATGKRRQRLPAFDARCRAALAEHRAAAAPAPAGGEVGSGDEDGDGVANRVRFDGWTPVRRRAFLRALAETGVYARACRKVGLSKTSADYLRGRQPAFAAACERALGQAAGVLEQVAFERAVDGWEEPIVHAGKVVGQRRRYSDALLRLLIQAEARKAAAREAARQAEAARPAPRMAREEVDALLASKLDALARRNRREERARQIAWADEMVRRGLAP